MDSNGSKGRVVPHALNWKRRQAATLIALLIRGARAALRFRWEFAEQLVATPPARAIHCVWHNRLPLCLLIYQQYKKVVRQPPRMAAMVSASKDGSIVAGVLERFGAQPVRGSTSRRGPQALLELTTWAEKGYDLAITPDGPRGPRYHVQPGIIALAQLTQFPIIPTSYHLHSKITFNSWDRFQLPLPLTRVVVKMGVPLDVPPDATEEQREHCRDELERRLLDLAPD